MKTVPKRNFLEQLTKIAKQIKKGGLGELEVMEDDDRQASYGYFFRPSRLTHRKETCGTDCNIDVAFRNDGTAELRSGTEIIQGFWEEIAKRLVREIKNMAEADKKEFRRKADAIERGLLKLAS
ncbi:MAG: hypothetical protein KGJ13_03990 [Patescibacteria group bacterium]|nr:hypothetical protein [Patescibacteria group bacterium]